MKELLRAYRPVIVILLESKVSGDMADGFCRKLGMNRWVRLKAEGFSSGILMLGMRRISRSLLSMHADSSFMLRGLLQVVRIGS